MKIFVKKSNFSVEKFGKCKNFQKSIFSFWCGCVFEKNFFPKFFFEIFGFVNNFWTQILKRRIFLKKFFFIESTLYLWFFKRSNKIFDHIFIDFHHQGSGLIETHQWSIWWVNEKYLFELITGSKAIAIPTSFETINLRKILG